ncbi:MAG TPA: dual specificity protein phosphatase family protein [Solirubrobacteraceae bacterium]|jgi:hypothetical protein|nr:dual specificity protein phosphatase family protein [Solirubrobacteraceae bacterium]
MSSWFRAYGFGEILDGLLIGAYPLDVSDVGMLQMMGVQRVLNLCEDDEYASGQRPAVETALAEAGIEEQRISLTDFGGLPADRLERAVTTIDGWLDGGQVAYVHCRAGWQRSATVGAAVVAAREGLDPEQALAWVKRAKPSAEPLEHQREDLQRWFDERAATPPRADAAP